MSVDPTWLVAIAEGGRGGFWLGLGPGESPPPPRMIKPGEAIDYELKPQIAILLHSVCVGDGWEPELLAPSVAISAVERLGDTSQRWELPAPIEVGPASALTAIKLRLVNRSVETRPERDAILMRMPHLVHREAGDPRAAIRAAVRAAEEKLIDATNRARFAGLHDLADGLWTQSRLVNILAAHADIRQP